MGTNNLCRKGKRLLHSPARNVLAGSSRSIAAAGLSPAPQAATAPVQVRLSAQPLPRAPFANLHTPHIGSAAVTSCQHSSPAVCPSYPLPLSRSRGAGRPGEETERA